MEFVRDARCNIYNAVNTTLCARRHIVMAYWVTWIKQSLLMLSETANASPAMTSHVWLSVHARYCNHLQLKMTVLFVFAFPHFPFLKKIGHVCSDDSQDSAKPGLVRMCPYLCGVMIVFLCLGPGGLPHGDRCDHRPGGWQHANGDGRGQDQAEWHHLLHWYQPATGTKGEHGGHVSAQEWHEWVLKHAVCLFLSFLQSIKKRTF